jgi:hypothetical protein
MCMEDVRIGRQLIPRSERANGEAGDTVEVFPPRGGRRAIIATMDGSGAADPSDRAFIAVGWGGDNPTVIGAVSFNAPTLYIDVERYGPLAEASVYAIFGGMNGNAVTVWELYWPADPTDKK